MTGSIFTAVEMFSKAYNHTAMDARESTLKTETVVTV